MKKLLALFVAMLVVLSACSSSVVPSSANASMPATQPSAEASPSPTTQPEPSPALDLTGDISQEDLQEVLLAQQLGLLPPTLSGKYSDPIKAKDMKTLAIGAVELYYGIKIDPDFKELTALEDASTVTRRDAAGILTQATKVAWGECPWPNGSPWKPEELTDRISSDDALIWDAPSEGEETIRPWSGVTWPKEVVSIIFATGQVDKVTGKPLIPLSTEWRFKPNTLLSQLQAIQSAVRLYRSFDPKTEYVSLEEVPTHTIPKQLYSDNSTLPDASNQKLPAWRGVAHFPGCWAPAETMGTYNDVSYRQSDFIAMREAGLNMVALYISPTRLSFPYGEEDVRKVNLAQLLMLDQALGWAFENGLHVQLSFNGVPGVGRYIHAEGFDFSRLFNDEETAKLLADLWGMLARRYADIPNRYLGFTLLNEVDPPNDEEYLRVFGPAVDAIWAQSPDRVVAADIHSANITGESMAKKGVALSRHQYVLPLMDYSLGAADGGGLMELYPDYAQELTWPQLYLPSMLHDNGNTVTLQGPFAAGELAIGINQVGDGGEVLAVRIDGKQAFAQPMPADGEKNHWNLLKVNQEYVVPIPEGSKTIELFNQSGKGLIVYNRLKLTQSGKADVILYPHDTFNINWQPESVTINFAQDGSVADNRFLTWEDMRTMGEGITYDSVKKMAEQYGVGFMVGEIGPFGEDGLPKPVFEGYVDMMFDGLKQDDVTWVHAQSIGPAQLLNTHEVPGWEYEKLENSPYYVNTFVRDMLKKHAQ